MEDPIRLCEEGSDELASMLLEAGRHDAPSGTRLNRIIGGMTAAGVTVATSAAAAEVVTGAAALGAGAQSALPFAILVKWTGIGIIAGLATALGVNALNRDASEDARASSSVNEVEAAVVAGQAREPSTRLVGPRGEATSDVSAVENPRTRRHQSATHDVAAGDPAATEDPTASALREEVAALAVAKAALNRAAPRDAIEAVIGYRARFPKGHLMPEAAVIEMEAQLALGNRGRALELGRELEKTPTPGAERARELLRRGTP
jgi:hypothetical protein